MHARSAGGFVEGRISMCGSDRSERSPFGGVRAKLRKKATATPTRNGNAPPSWRGPALQTDVAAVPPDFTRDQRSRRGTALRRATSPQWNSNEMDQASLQRPAKRDAISPSSSVALGDVSVRIDRGPIVSSVSDVAYDVRKTSSCLHVFDVL